jgi:AraC-like DNA-binding protein
MLLRSIIFAGAVQGLFLILLLQSKNKGAQSDYYLMLWLFLVSMQLFFYYDNQNTSPFFNGISGIFAFSIPLLSGPILFQYICSLSFGKKVVYKRLIIYFAPWLAYIFMTGGIKLSHPLDIFIKFGYPHFSSNISSVTVYLFTLPMAIVPGCYAVMGLVELRRYQKSLPDEYSYTENINLNWLKWLVFTILILFLVLFLFIRFGTQTHLASGDTLFVYVGALLSLYVFLVGYFGFRQSNLFVSAKREMSVENMRIDVPYKKSGVDRSAVEQIYLRLLRHMEIQKPFLRNDLSLALLANQLSINSNQLSQVINQKSGSNFFVFVNRYRVEEVKIKLLDPSLSHLSILGIAYDCGFRSKSAFNRIFKEITGVGPREFQRENQP